MGKVRWNFVHVSRFCCWIFLRCRACHSALYRRRTGPADGPTDATVHALRVSSIFYGIQYSSLFQFYRAERNFFFSSLVRVRVLLLSESSTSSLFFFGFGFAYLLPTSKHRMNCVNFVSLLCLFTYHVFITVQFLQHVELIWMAGSP